MDTIILEDQDQAPKQKHKSYDDVVAVFYNINENEITNKYILIHRISTIWRQESANKSFRA